MPCKTSPPETLPMPRVLIVDDSALMRKQLVSMLADESDFEIETARNGREALEQLERFGPDVITLDINMPEMDGLTALSHIMTRRPTPVIMVSSLTEKGALATLEAMALGAVDYVAKPDGTISLSINQVREDLLTKLRTAAQVRPRTGRPERSGSSPVSADGDARTSSPATQSRVRPADRRPASKVPTVTTTQRLVAASAAATRSHGLVLVGVSTGGPRTLESILPRLPVYFPWPVVVAQHMPMAFTASFANRLDGQCAMNVREISQPTPLEVGTIYIAQGGADLLISDRGGKLYGIVKPADRRYNWHPSVQAMVESALLYCQPNSLITVMLTGMGDDGADAMVEVHRRGGRTIAESERSSVVFGMPGELIKRGGAGVVLDAEEIAEQLVQWIIH
jgi:two-component system chemotaxis response regulator CheB